MGVLEFALSESFGGVCRWGSSAFRFGSSGFGVVAGEQRHRGRERERERQRERERERERERQAGGERERNKDRATDRLSNDRQIASP